MQKTSEIRIQNRFFDALWSDLVRCFHTQQELWEQFAQPVATHCYTLQAKTVGYHSYVVVLCLTATSHQCPLDGFVQQLRRPTWKVAPGSTVVRHEERVTGEEGIADEIASSDLKCP